MRSARNQGRWYTRSRWAGLTGYETSFVRFHSVQSRDDEEEKLPLFLGRPKGTGRAWSWTRSFICVVLLLILCFAFILPSITYRASSIRFQEPSVAPEKPTYLRLIVSGSEPSTDLCRTLVSAAILDYSTPLLVDPNEARNEGIAVPGDARTSVIDGVLRHLDGLRTQDEDDLVLLVEGSNTWFQLRADVLINRYYAIVHPEKANKQAGIAETPAEQREGRHKVVFSSQKHCRPAQDDITKASESQPWWYVGHRHTDTHLRKARIRDIDDRSHCLDSSFIMGPVKDVRTLMRRAMEEVEKRTPFISDESIFAQVFAEQEYDRFLRSVMPKPISHEFMGIKWRSIVPDSVDGIAFDEPKQYQALSRYDMDRTTTYDFGIGLDYENQLLQPLSVSNEKEVTVSELSSTPSSDSASRQKGSPSVRVEDGGSESLADIIASEPPFFSLRGGSFPSGMLPSNRSWADVPLFRQQPVGVIPAMVGAGLETDHVERQHWWSQMWFKPYARALMDKHVTGAVRPVAVSTITGREHAWWSVNNKKGGVEFGNREFRFYDDFCRGRWEEDVEGEGEGEGVWLDPRFGFD